MADEFKVSVIIPAYNHGRYLGEAIQSVLDQSLKPFEIIIVDDGSTDNTRSVAESFLPLISYHYQNKTSTGSARNLGIQNATGNFIAHLDADDIWLAKKLELQKQKFDQDPDLEIVGGLMQPFYSPEINEEELKNIYCSPDPLPSFSASLLLVKRTSFLQVGFYRTDLTLGQDLDWFARARETGLKEKVIQQVLAKRRLHRTNSSQRNKSHNLDRVRILKDSLERRRSKNKPQDRTDV